MQNSNENFTEQANELIAKVKLHYNKKDCKFDVRVYQKVFLKKTEIWYSYYELVHEIVKLHINVIEHIALVHDDKGDISYLEKVIDEVSLLRLKNPLYKLKDAEEILYKKLFTIESDLREYYMKLVWFNLPLEDKQKWMRVGLKEQYGKEISNTKYDEFLAYLSHKYM